MAEKSWCINCGAEIKSQENLNNCPHCNANLKTGKIPKPKIEELVFTEAVLKPRMYLFLELLIVVVFQFAIKSVLNLLFGTYDTAKLLESPPHVLLSWFIVLFSWIVGSIVGLFVNEAIIYDKAPFPNPDDITPVKEVFSAFKITKLNFRYQLLYGFLFLFLFLIPMDFLTNILPGMLEYSFISLTGGGNPNPRNIYLVNDNLGYFLTFAMLISLCVGIYEEHFFRGISISRGRRYIGKYSSIIIFSIAFGIGHFSYLTLFIGDPNFNHYLIYAIIWFVESIILGWAFSLFYMKKRYIWPLIFAHFANNVISLAATWMYNTKNFSYSTISGVLYLPLIAVSIILAIKYKSKIKEALKEFKELIPNYISEIGRLNAKVPAIILIDLCFALALFLVTIF